jgi:glycosidase
MEETAPGIYECYLSLNPGVYRYKFRVNHEQWIADAYAAKDPTEGYNNSLLVVDGSNPPIFFAPDRGHLAVYEDGNIVIHMESDGRDAEPISIDGKALLEEYQGERHGRHFSVFRSKVIPTTETMPTLQVGAYRTRLPQPRSSLGQPPAWAKRAVFYAIVIDRWRRGSKSLPDKRFSTHNTPSTNEVFYGGDLWGVAEGLDYLSKLGVDAVIITPVQTAPSPHRYDGLNLMEIEPSIGGEKAFDNLVAETHRHGLRLVVDASLTHVHEHHPFFQSVLSEQQASPYCDWFHIHKFPVRARDPDCIDLYPTEPHLPWLNLNTPAARTHVIEAALRLVRRGIDGLRLDAMTRAPKDFWAELRQQVRGENPEALLLGEVVTDRPACFAEERGIDMATDFFHRQTILDFFRHQTIYADEMVDRLKFHEFRVGPFEPVFRLLFLDNHDTDRFLMPYTHYALLRLALTYLLVRPEPIWLNYGTEMALRQPDVKSHYKAIPERMPMPPLALGINQTQKLVQNLLLLRHQESALQNDCISWVYASKRILVFDRGDHSNKIRIAINTDRDRIDLSSWLAPATEYLLQVDAGIIEKPGVLAPLSAVIVRL